MCKPSQDVHSYLPNCSFLFFRVRTHEQRMCRQHSCYEGVTTMKMRTRIRLGICVPASCMRTSTSERIRPGLACALQHSGVVDRLILGCRVMSAYLVWDGTKSTSSVLL